MALLALIPALALIFGVLWDAFETVILPRRVRRRLRITSVVYRLSWAPWSDIARHVRSSTRRESFLSLYGPLALIFLLVVWALGLVFGFALFELGCGSSLAAGNTGPRNCSRAICRTRRWATSARNTSTNPGWPR